ncbi:hypothetical protein [Undibacterium sp. RuTC16W]|uniref:hypothetical protein n=1 Tax=Undibacterium sp. RuTC16W TaxID=3413048 RepID=UPI003BF3B43E
MVFGDDVTGCVVDVVVDFGPIHGVVEGSDGLFSTVATVGIVVGLVVRAGGVQGGLADATNAVELAGEFLSATFLLQVIVGAATVIDDLCQTG